MFRMTKRAFEKIRIVGRMVRVLVEAVGRKLHFVHGTVTRFTLGVRNDNLTAPLRHGVMTGGAFGLRMMQSRGFSGGLSGKGRGGPNDDRGRNE